MTSNTRTHVHEEPFSSSVSAVFDALVTPSSVRSWWGASGAIIQPFEGGVWAAIWGEEDAPTYSTVATISTFIPPNKLILSNYRYQSKDGPLPFEAHFETEFTVEQHEKGVILRVEQKGFPAGTEADAFFNGCVAGWTETFKGIRAFLRG